jgi:hypothetical protein
MWRRVPCEQQLNMGQSALRNRRNPFEKSQRDKMKNCGHCENCPKGNWVNIPKLRHGDSFFGSKRGNAIKLVDVGGSPGKSCLFFVSFRLPENSLPGDRDVVNVKHRGSCGVQSATVGP